jgi:hypothetical protein
VNFNLPYTESPIQGWKEALNRFTILWPERMPQQRGASTSPS